MPQRNSCRAKFEPLHIKDKQTPPTDEANFVFEVNLLEFAPHLSDFDKDYSQLEESATGLSLCGDAADVTKRAKTVKVAATVALRGCGSPNPRSPVNLPIRRYVWRQ
jgi:hypothetical protein